MKTYRPTTFRGSSPSPERVNLLAPLEREEALAVYARLGLHSPRRRLRHLFFRNPRRTRTVLLPEGGTIRVDTLLDNLEAGGFTADEFFRVLAEVRERRR